MDGRMNRVAIEKVIKEATETIEAAQAVLAEADDANHWAIWGSKYTGALRRRSMDLTRALAEMRKP